MGQKEALDILENKIKESEKKILKMYREAIQNDDPIELTGVFITDLLNETILTTQEIARLINKTPQNTSKCVNKLVKQGEVKVIKSSSDERIKRYVLK